MEITRDILDTIKRIAFDWTAGVVIIRPFGGDILVLAVTSATRYSPSNNIYYSTISGKDITLMVIQKLSIADPRGHSPVVSYIDNIQEEQTWELTPEEQWYWLRVRDIR
jgi:hypothetical protein